MNDRQRQRPSRPSSDPLHYPPPRLHDPYARLQDIAAAWEKYKQARGGTTDGVNEFVILAQILDAILE